MTLHVAQTRSYPYHPALATQFSNLSDVGRGARPFSTQVVTDRVRLTLISCSESAPEMPIEGLYRPVYSETATDLNSAANKSMAWLWEACTRDETPLGFLALSPVLEPKDGIHRFFGPVLTTCLMHDPVRAAYGAEAIDSIATWLGDHHFAKVVHAAHAADDHCLAKWLIEAGFIYTGAEAEGRKVSNRRYNQREMLRFL